MASLHEAFQSLGPVAWKDVPQDSPEALQQFVQDTFRRAQLLVESVPAPTTDTGGRPSGLDDTTESAVSSRSAILAHLGVSESELAALQKEWGKTIKMNNTKENPLGIPMYKLSGKDGKGAWFARRTIHEGLAFRRWKEKMQAEMGETLEARQEELKQGRVPEKAIRGIGGDRLLERLDVFDSSSSSSVAADSGPGDSGRKVGQIDVYELSAQFPGPTTPRDFVTLILTTDELPSQATSEEDNVDADQLPPTYLVVSKPCDHPDSPPRDGYIRGQYESVELIREILVHPHAGKAQARDGLKNDSNDNGNPERAASADGPNKSQHDKEESEDNNEDANPVEWIMITRSDPGGSVPRWMVERGTPKSIVSDAGKFLNWASQPDLISPTTEGDVGEILQNQEGQEHRDRAAAESSAVTDQDPEAAKAEVKGGRQVNKAADSDGAETGLSNSGLLTNVTNMIQSGLETYAPKSVLDYMPSHTGNQSNASDQNIAIRLTPADDDDTESVGSVETFTSADSNIAPESEDNLATRAPENDNEKATSSTPALSTRTGASGNDLVAETLSQSSKKTKPSSQEKDLAKLAERRRQAEQKLADVRAELESVGIQSTQKDEGESGMESERGSIKSGQSASAKFDPNTTQDPKKAAKLARDETKLLSQLRKVEEQQLKLAHKIEARQRKEAQRADKQRSRSEIEELRREVNDLKSQVKELRGEREQWLGIVGRLQKENAQLSVEKDEALKAT